MILYVLAGVFKTTGMTARDVHGDNTTHDLSEVSAGGTL